MNRCGIAECVEPGLTNHPLANSKPARSMVWSKDRRSRPTDSCSIIPPRPAAGTAFAACGV